MSLVMQGRQKYFLGYKGESERKREEKSRIKVVIAKDHWVKGEVDGRMRRRGTVHGQAKHRSFIIGNSGDVERAMMKSTISPPSL